jgi:hypothetical protein
VTVDGPRWDFHISLIFQFDNLFILIILMPLLSVSFHREPRSKTSKFQRQMSRWLWQIKIIKNWSFCTKGAKTTIHLLLMLHYPLSSSYSIFYFHLYPMHTMPFIFYDWKMENEDNEK